MMVKMNSQQVSFLIMMNVEHELDDGEYEFPADFEDFDWEDSGQKDVDNESDNDEEGDVSHYNCENK
ncbi:hypothetical protein LXL04_029441 [Taraxacum kok-saghyz]